MVDAVLGLDELAGGLGQGNDRRRCGGGLTEGATQDYEIVLEAGEYLYSCPLNPTPDYKLVVEG